MLKQRKPSISVFVMGILPAEETSWGRESRIDEVNSILEGACSTRDFLFVGPGVHWRGSYWGINRSLFFDGLHMSKKGNVMLGKMYENVLDRKRKRIVIDEKSHIHTTPSPLTHVMMDGVAVILPKKHGISLGIGKKMKTTNSIRMKKKNIIKMMKNSYTQIWKTERRSSRS